MAAILRAGVASYARDLGEQVYRERLLTGEVEIRIVAKCGECGENCYEKFDGKALFIIGLNNTIKAPNLPFVKLNENTGFMMNAQDFDGMFKYLDDSIAEVNECLFKYRCI